MIAPVNVRLPEDMLPWGEHRSVIALGTSPEAAHKGLAGFGQQDWESAGAAEHLSFVRRPGPEGSPMSDPNDQEWSVCVDTIGGRQVIVETKTRPAGLFGAARASYTLSAQFELAAGSSFDVDGRSDTREGRQRLLAALYTVQFTGVDTAQTRE
jgi:hypothetical protein